MKLTHLAGMFLGSTAMFVACTVQQADKGNDTSAEDSGITALIDAAEDALRDTMRDTLGADIAPTKDAAAAPPTTVSAKCDKSTTAGGSTIHYAEASFPGRTKEQLMTASVLLCNLPTSGSWTAPLGYTCSKPLTYVKDGGILVACADSTGTVTFSVPTL